MWRKSDFGDYMRRRGWWFRAAGVSKRRRFRASNGVRAANRAKDIRVSRRVLVAAPESRYPSRDQPVAEGTRCRDPSAVEESIECSAAIIICPPRSRDSPRRLSAPLRDYSARRLLLVPASRHESAFFNLRRQPVVMPGICVTNRYRAD